MAVISQLYLWKSGACRERQVHKTHRVAIVNSQLDHSGRNFQPRTEGNSEIGGLDALDLFFHGPHDNDAVSVFLVVKKAA